MATTEDRLGRVPGISDPGLNLAGGLVSLDTGLREGVREIRDELRGLNVWLEAKASTWLVGAGIACPGLRLAGVIAGLTLLTRR